MSYGESTIVDKVDPQQRELADVAQKKYDWYKRKYVPLENSWIKQVGEMDAPVYHNEAAGMTANTVKQSDGIQTKKFGASMVGNKVGMADYLPSLEKQVEGATTASNNVTGRMVKGKEGIVAMGNGQSGEAIQGLSQVAQNSVHGRINQSNNEFNDQQANNSIYGTGAGMATAALLRGRK
jgi:hypothetical protein